MMLLACLCTLLPMASAVQRGTRTSYAPPEGTGATVTVVQPGGTVDLQAGPTGGPEDEASMAEIRRTTTQKSTTKTTKLVENVEGAQSFVTMPDGSKLPMTLVDGEWRVGVLNPDSAKELGHEASFSEFGNCEGEDHTVFISLKDTEGGLGFAATGSANDEGGILMKEHTDAKLKGIVKACGFAYGDIITRVTPFYFVADETTKVQTGKSCANDSKEKKKGIEEYVAEEGPDGGVWASKMPAIKSLTDVDGTTTEECVCTYSGAEDLCNAKKTVAPGDTPAESLTSNLESCTQTRRGFEAGIEVKYKRNGVCITDRVCQKGAGVKGYATKGTITDQEGKVRFHYDGLAITK